jgi:hypothetical protein
MKLQCEHEQLVKQGQPKVTPDADGYAEGVDDAEKGKNADFDMLRFKVYYSSDDAALSGSSRPDALHFTITEGPRPKMRGQKNVPPVASPIEIDGKKRAFFGYKTPFVYVYRVVPTIEVKVARTDSPQTAIDTKTFVLHIPPNRTTPGKMAIEAPFAYDATGAWDPPKYCTIADVLADPTAKRRWAILAGVLKEFPKTNNGAHNADGEGQKAAPIMAGTDARWKQGKYGKVEFEYKGPKGGTSCTTVNIAVYDETKPSKNDQPGKFWAFGAWPYHPLAGGQGNPGWVKGGRLPSVGDTYLLSNKSSAPDDSAWDTGHCGVILEIPKDGNGLWITADGGQGQTPNQLSIIVPRWGIIGTNLPEGGRTNDKGAKEYPDLPKQTEQRPWLTGDSGVGRGPDIPADGPDRITQLLAKINYSPNPPKSPRRLLGTVDVDAKAINFDIDNKDASGLKADVEALQTKVNTVKADFFSDTKKSTAYGGT